jgi:hypothetical protein
MSPVTISSLQKQAEEIPFNQIAVDETTFQFRDIEADGARSRQVKKKSNDHVNNLVNIIKAGNQLDPIMVWKDPEGKYTLIDGHHRHKAYKRVLGKSSDKLIMCRVLNEDVTRQEAIQQALSANIKDKLMMTKPQKTQAAWRFFWGEDGATLNALSDRKSANWLMGLVTHGTINKLDSNYSKH